MSDRQLFSPVGDQGAGDAGCCPPVYDADRCIQLHRQRCGALVRIAAQAGVDRSWPQRQVLFRRGAWSPGQYLDNAVGRILLDLAGAAPQRFLDRDDQLRSRRAVALAWLLLRAQEQPPRGLHEIEGLPPDPWSGEPLRYDFDQSRIWSAMVDELELDAEQSRGLSLEF